jgi:subtilisin family serine protease
MRNHSSQHRRLPTPNVTRKATVESLETRSLLATWSSYAQLVGQDDAASLYSSLTGKGQTVALIDTGIDYNNASLGGGFGAGHKVIAGYDFYQNDADPMDTDGHGTETAGMIAANSFTQGGVTYQGIAPDASLVALRVGTGEDITDARIEKALQWIITNYKTYGITVVNLSLGSGAYAAATTANSQLADEFATLASLDIFVVAASGNNGTSQGGTVSYPAADPNVFAVGSITAADQISSFTQRGKELDLLAPGEDVVTTAKGGGYTTVDGTSFSSPLVAGVVALLRQAASSLSVKDLASVLRTSSTTQYDGDGDAGETTKEVYARLNIVAAITLASSLNSDGDLDYILGSKNSTFDSAYDASGILHLAYYDPARARLMFATQKSDGTWTTPVVVDKTGDRVGSQLSLAIDQTGKAAIAYYNATEGDLKYAWYTGTKWSNTTLDSNKTVGMNPSLVFSDAGDPRISYYKKNGGDLKLDSYDRTTGLWTRTVLDSEGDVGLNSSIAYQYTDSNSYVLAVAYSDKTNGNLKYWRYNTDDTTNGGYYSAMVDDLSGVSNIDLKLLAGNNGGARIAYQDTTNADVKVAYRSETWSTIVVNSSGSSGQSVQSYVDSDGTYHVVYYSKTKGATYDSTIVASLTTLGGSASLTAVLGTTTRIGSSGQVASIAVVDDIVTLVGLNKSGKSIDSSDIDD